MKSHCQKAEGTSKKPSQKSRRWFQGEAKIQTVFFTDEASNARNAATVVSFLEKIGAPVSPRDPRARHKPRNRHVTYAE
jgi:hypothetical protein